MQDKTAEDRMKDIRVSFDQEIKKLIKRMEKWTGKIIPPPISLDFGYYIINGYPTDQKIAFSVSAEVVFNNWDEKETKYETLRLIICNEDHISQSIKHIREGVFFNTFLQSLLEDVIIQKLMEKISDPEKFDYITRGVAEKSLKYIINKLINNSF